MHRLDGKELLSRLASPEQRFWSFVNKTLTCWLWTGALLEGYGIFNRGKGKNVRAPRFSYELVHGQIAPGLFVCHTCDNPQCVRPEHLFVGAPRDNTADMVRKGRGARGSKSGRAKLTEQDVEIIRNRIASGEIQSRIADEFGVTDTTISNIKTRTWSHVAGSTKPSTRIGSANRLSVLTEDAVVTICRRLKSGELGEDLAREYRVSRATISRVRNGLRWKHVPRSTVDGE